VEVAGKYITKLYKLHSMHNITFVTTHYNVCTGKKPRRERNIIIRNIIVKY